jgi:hypothetical protein
LTFCAVSPHNILKRSDVLLTQDLYRCYLHEPSQCPTQGNFFHVNSNIDPDKAAKINSERVYCVSADQCPSMEVDLNEVSRGSAPRIFEFTIAADKGHLWLWLVVPGLCDAEPTTLKTNN